jgi:hypothetical protein
MAAIRILKIDRNEDIGSIMDVTEVDIGIIDGIIHKIATVVNISKLIIVVSQEYFDIRIVEIVIGKINFSIYLL